MRNDVIFIVICKGSRTPQAFGSIAAIFDAFGPNGVGLPQYKVWGAVEAGKPLKTDKMTIYKTNVVRRRQKTDE